MAIIRKINKITNGKYNGNSTNHHDHEMIPINFNAINNTVNKLNIPTPLP